MALAHVLPISSPPPWRSVGSGVIERRKAMPLGVVEFLAGKGVVAVLRRRVLVDGSELGSRGVVVGSARLGEAMVPVVEQGQNRRTVEIPVTCYQILGVSEQAEKDAIVKAVMELKNSEIEDGYTADIIRIRQDVLMDVRDKLLFEQEYSGNIKEKVPPKSSLRIPWAWLPGVLSLLQEVGEEKLVLEIGRTALQHPNAKPYIHDLLLSMASAECSIAKTCFEKSKVSEGFEALARAQHLLRSEISLAKMPLLMQVEESLKELAPACTLELLGMPFAPNHAEHRQRAILALHELLRQGLNVETSCRVQDWPCFLSRAMNKLTATEIVGLLSWDTLATIRKNKKSIQSQHQRIVIDFNCFYLAMLAHIAVGFSTRQIEIINKAKTISGSLMESESTNLKFEEAFCSFLLGQEDQKAVAEKLHQLEINRSLAAQDSELACRNKEEKDKNTVERSLENWLKESVLDVFPETRGCSPSLASFFGGLKWMLRGGRHKNESVKAPISHRSSSFGLSLDCVPEEPVHMNSTRHLGEAVRRLAPANLRSQPTLGKTSGSTSGPSVQLKRNPGQAHAKIWESWWPMGDITGSMACGTLLGCILVGSFKLFTMRFEQNGIPYQLNSSQSKLNTQNIVWTLDQSPELGSNFACNNKISFGQLWKLLDILGQAFRPASDAGNNQNKWHCGDILSPTMAGASSANIQQKRQMPLEEAEALVRRWQEIKGEALGPNHQIRALPEILAELMLSKWEDLANAAKTSLCFWRFVLLQLSIIRAEIISDGIGTETAEIEAILEEAAELVDDSQLKNKNTNYYSTYKILYVLKRCDDGSWKFCGGLIQDPA